MIVGNPHLNISFADLLGVVYLSTSNTKLAHIIGFYSMLDRQASSGITEVNG